MRPFRQRLFVVLWVLYLVWGAGVTVFLAQPFLDAKPEVFRSPAREELEAAIRNADRAGDLDAARKLTAVLQQQNGSVVIPDAVVGAYRAGKMTRQEAREFETDLRSGAISLPFGEKLEIAPHLPDALHILGSVALLLLAPAGLIVALQYLVLGIANPYLLIKAAAEKP